MRATSISFCISARDILGRPIEGGGYFRLSDESIRDIPVAARKALEPGLTEMPVELLADGRGAAGRAAFLPAAGRLGRSLRYRAQMPGAKAN